MVPLKYFMLVFQLHTCNTLFLAKLLLNGFAHAIEIWKIEKFEISNGFISQTGQKAISIFSNGFTIQKNSSALSPRLTCLNTEEVNIKFPPWCPMIFVVHLEINFWHVLHLNF